MPCFARVRFATPEVVHVRACKASPLVSRACAKHPKRPSLIYIQCLFEQWWNVYEFRKRREIFKSPLLFLRIAGLEPARQKAPGPKPGVFTNSTIPVLNFTKYFVRIPLFLKHRSFCTLCTWCDNLWCRERSCRFARAYFACTSLEVVHMLHVLAQPPVKCALHFTRGVACAKYAQYKLILSKTIFFNRTPFQHICTFI